MILAEKKKFSLLKSETDKEIKKSIILCTCYIKYIFTEWWWICCKWCDPENWMQHWICSSGEAHKKPDVCTHTHTHVFSLLDLNREYIQVKRWHLTWVSCFVHAKCHRFTKAIKISVCKEKKKVFSVHSCRDFLITVFVWRCISCSE